MEIALWVIVVVELAGLITLGVLLAVSRRALAASRRERRRRTTTEVPRRRRGSPLAVAPLAIRTVTNTVQTADAIIRRQVTGPVRSSIEDLAGWARIERPDLARITADGSVVLVFSDIEGSTQRNASLGDREWVDILGRHERLVRHHVSERRGVVVKNQGDGFMMAFSEPIDAVRCSIAIQQALAGDSPRGDAVRIRVGAHVGTSVRRGDDLFGLDVAMAARVADLATGGEILISDALRRRLGDVDDLDIGPAREVELKGLPGTQQVHAVGVPDAAPRNRR